jgi:hypothetical protein
VAGTVFGVVPVEEPFTLPVFGVVPVEEPFTLPVFGVVPVEEPFTLRSVWCCACCSSF